MRVPPPAALICLDLQRGRLSGAADGGAVAACQFVLAQARTRRWPVLHVRRREQSPDAARPILGLEPLASEPVYVRSGPSAFSSHAFAQAAQALGGPLALIGFSLRDTVLATAIAAADRNLLVEILVDAVVADVADRLAPTYASLSPHCRLINSDDLLQKEAALVKAANTP